MLPEKYQWILRQFEPEGDVTLLLEIAEALEAAGNREGAAAVLDRAYGIDPTLERTVQLRTRVLDQLAIVEQGIRFRYIPAGPFLMGWDQGEPDEQPLHPVWLRPYWLSETAISWSKYCEVMDWAPPPAGAPREEVVGFNAPLFHLHQETKIRLQYCEDRTTRARDWHAHAPGQMWQSQGREVTAQELFGAPPRDDPEAPWRYDTKPMIAVSWQEAEEMAQRLSSETVRYGLPTEAQWEKAARGGLIGARHAWGNDPPSEESCDYDRFDHFSILPMTTFPPNDYGLFAMNGSVWEWCADWYDGDYYRHAPDTDPTGPSSGEEKVLRGGSWADCWEVVTVTYRMSRGSANWRSGQWGAHESPTIGFRLCRMTVTPNP